MANQRYVICHRVADCSPIETTRPDHCSECFAVVLRGAASDNAMPDWPSLCLHCFMKRRPSDRVILPPSLEQLMTVLSTLDKECPRCGNTYEQHPAECKGPPNGWISP